MSPTEIAIILLTITVVMLAIVIIVLLGLVIVVLARLRALTNQAQTITKPSIGHCMAQPNHSICGCSTCVHEWWQKEEIRRNYEEIIKYTWCGCGWLCSW